MIAFGPVPSRRLGKSLGINNIITPKTCSYNCIYCQVGKTVRKSFRRESFFSPDAIYRNIEQHLAILNKEARPDYLTFVSNGEPTLDINLGSSLAAVKKTGIPVAVITNASLLYDKDVRNELLEADWVSVKIDAGDAATWKALNRPCEGLDFNTLIGSIILFAGEYRGKLCTETMLIDGVNDKEENFRAVAEIISKINPFKSYISVPIRPPSVEGINGPQSEKLNQA